MACDLIVIPFSRSRSILSRTCSFIFDLGTVPVSSSRRSASVDLPWSMCAMMQKLRTVSRRVMGSEADSDGERQRGVARQGRAFRDGAGLPEQRGRAVLVADAGG